jgi:hypothetical protein
MSRLLSDVDTLSQLFAQGMTQLMGALFALVGIMGARLWQDVRLALACFLIIPAMVLTTWLFAARARKAYRKTRETVGDVTANLQEEIVGVRQAQAFNRTELNIQRFRTATPPTGTPTCRPPSPPPFLAHHRHAGHPGHGAGDRLRRVAGPQRRAVGGLWRRSPLRAMLPAGSFSGGSTR